MQTPDTNDPLTNSDSEAQPADSAVVGSDLEIGYASTDEPVVTVDRIDVPRGEITALVGPNGSGKSTLLKTLARQLGPDEGEVLLEGKDVQTYDQKALARELGHLSQENDAPETVTVENLVAHGRYPYRGFFESLGESDAEAIARAIDLAGVEDLREEPVGNLSGGQKQLVFIAMVLAQDTDVLLLDEPTTFLDLHHQLRVMETVTRLNEERDVTVVVVLHDIAQAARFADYLIALDDGSVYDWGPPTDVVTEALLRDVFDIEAAVRYTPDPEIVPKHSL
ncbi:ABC transporter ATP-binding protein [Haloarcula pellucida]|uniref:Cobalamin import ATP-binding protein BtuD n=1 Tax=Haloarcula pellucida TaxID=1427151 RepID=A0A830GHT7_9EURY|nr:ABC transporter ATP-binding protein [Halomicroarcula pellucida]MBX0347501.1 ABC transporter ATP-binding protein [Halomicroarcula pellucida]GGN88979.1 ferrichrome ABC transporter ATP-binding protein [Halomicroarcula pellucida]